MWISLWERNKENTRRFNNRGLKICNIQIRCGKSCMDGAPQNRNETSSNHPKRTTIPKKIKKAVYLAANYIISESSIQIRN